MNDLRHTRDGGEVEAAIAAVAAHLAELDEAKQDGDDELWNDISSDGVEVKIGGATWELWFGQDGWTAARPTLWPEFPGESEGVRRRRPDGPRGPGDTVTQGACPAAGHARVRGLLGN